MSSERRRATMRIAFPGLIAGGLCGAAIGLDLVSQPVGIAAAIVVGVVVAVLVIRANSRFKA
jgi:hypothetical protein